MALPSGTVALFCRANGAFATIFAPDFPNIVIENIDFGCGVQLVKEKISEEVLTMFMPPVPTPGEQIMLSAGQMIVQVAVGE